jgi:hypothetical protein
MEVEPSMEFMREAWPVYRVSIAALARCCLLLLVCRLHPFHKGGEVFEGSILVLVDRLQPVGLSHVQTSRGAV